MTIEIWQRCCNLKHNYIELEADDLDEQYDADANPFLSDDDEEFSRDLDEIIYENGTLSTKHGRKKRDKDLV
tara:strand:- start:1007 stop:1222 length:216 start_codon:yes stop_codon:yes gene_type:complete